MENKYKLGDWVFVIESSSWLFRGTTEFGITYCRVLEVKENDAGFLYSTMLLKWKESDKLFKTFEEAKEALHNLQSEVDGYLETKNLD